MIEFEIGLKDDGYKQGLKDAVRFGKASANAVIGSLNTIKSAGPSAMKSLGGSFVSVGKVGVNTMRGLAKTTKTAAMSMSKSMSNAANSIVGQIALIAGAATFGQGFADNRELERAQAEVSTLSATAGVDVEKLTMQVREMAAAMGTDGLTATKALYNAISSGVKPTEALVFLRSTAELASAGVTDLATATKAVSGVMNAYGLSGAEAAKVSDTLFSIVDRGTTTMPELSQALSNVVPAMAAAKVPINEMGASMATLTTVLTDSGKASTQLSALMTSFQKPSKQASDLAKELGFNLSASNIETNGLSGAMSELSVILDKVEANGGSVGETLAVLLGSTEAASAASILADSNYENFNKTLESFSKNAGITSERAAIMANTVDAKLSAATEMAKLEMQKFFTVIRGGIGTLIDGVGGVDQLSNAFGALRLGAQAAFKGLVAGAMFMLNGVTDALAGVSLAIRKTVETVTGDGVIGQVAKAIFPALKLVDHLPQSFNNSFASIGETMSNFEQNIAESQAERQRRTRQEYDDFIKLYNEAFDTLNAPPNAKATGAATTGAQAGIAEARAQLQKFATQNQQVNEKIKKDDADTKSALEQNKRSFDAAMIDSQKRTDSQLAKIRSLGQSNALRTVNKFGDDLKDSHTRIYKDVVDSTSSVFSQSLHNALHKAAQISPVVATREFESDAAGRRVLEEVDRQLRMSIGFNQNAGGLVPARRESFGVDQLPGFSQGGIIRGPAGNDNLIARVSAGESIMTKNQTNELIAAIKQVKQGSTINESNQINVAMNNQDSREVARMIVEQQERARRMRRG